GAQVDALDDRARSASSRPALSLPRHDRCPRAAAVRADRGGSARAFALSPSPGLRPSSPRFAGEGLSISSGYRTARRRAIAGGIVRCTVAPPLRGMVRVVPPGTVIWNVPLPLVGSAT